MIRIATFTLGVLLVALPSGGQAPANSQMPDAAKPPVLNIPGDTTLLAKLNTNLDLEKCATGEAVEAETTRDVKEGKDVVLKKGSILIGHISFVELASSKQPENRVGVVFDRVKPKNGPEQSLHLIVRALAPQVEVPANSTIAGGRGMPGETTKAGIAGHDIAETGGIEPLSTSSVGVSNLPALDLGIRKAATGQQTTVLAWTKGDVKLKKGSQLVLLVVGQ